MLLRSSSNPALNSWFRHETLKESPSLNPVFIRHNPKTPTTSLYSINDQPKKITRASSEADLIGSSYSKGRGQLNKMNNSLLSSIAVEEDTAGENSDNEFSLFSTSGLYDNGGGGGGEGRSYGGDDNGNGNEKDSTDLYYRSMIEANPGNAMLLGNYAKYLKEVRGDFIKAEEYCSRTILANPNDGNVC